MESGGLGDSDFGAVSVETKMILFLNKRSFSVEILSIMLSCFPSVYLHVAVYVMETFAADNIKKSITS